MVASTSSLAQNPSLSIVHPGDGTVKLVPGVIDCDVGSGERGHLLAVQLDLEILRCG